MNRDMKTWIAAFAAALLGVVLALVEHKMAFNIWELCSAPFMLVGGGLRSLSLSGFGGNLAAWMVVLVVSALPLLLMRKHSRKKEDLLLVLSCGAVFAMLYYAVNPGLLDELSGKFYPIAALCTALSLLVGWWVLRLLLRLEGEKAQNLARALAVLLTACALLMAFASAYGPMGDTLTLQARFDSGDFMGRSRSLSITVLVFTTGIRIGLKVLAAQLMLLGAGLARELGRMEFDEQAVTFCQKTAGDCVKVVRRTVEGTAAINLLQLVFLSRLYDSSFQLEFPLLTLALAAGLYLLCRFLEQGHRLQLDSDSII